MGRLCQMEFQASFKQRLSKDSLTLIRELSTLCAWDGFEEQKSVEQQIPQNLCICK